MERVWGVLAFGAMLALAGCGGGGNGGANNTAAAPAPTPAPTPTIPTPPTPTPTPPGSSFTVGGTVSGLAGVGLTLQNNGGDDRAISANGPFTFAAALASGAAYNVTVASQPGAPAQSCVVAGGSGTIAANVSSITVACTTTPVAPTAGVWRIPEQVSNDPGDADTSQVAIDSSGNALAVWAESNGRGSRIWASRYETASGTWTTPAQIDPESTAANPAGDNSTVPQVAFDADGNGFVAWQRAGGQAAKNIWANRYDAASFTWGTAQVIGADNIGGIAPDVAAGGNGRAVVIWGQPETLSETTWTGVYDGAQWSAPTIISDPALNALPRSSTPCKPPQVAVNGDGEALAVWCHTASVSSRIYASRYASPAAGAAPSWGTAVRIDKPSQTALIPFPDEPQIAFAGNGAALALWIHETIEGSRVSASWYDGAADAWSTAQLIDAPAADRSEILVRPRIAVAPDGSATAVWLTLGPALNYSAYVDTCPPGVGPRRWNGTRSLGENNPVQTIDLAMDVLGNSTVVWRQFNIMSGSSSGILATRFNQTTYANAFNEAVTLNPLGRTSAAPAVAAYKDGSALAVWSESATGGGDRIWASRLRVLPTDP